MKENMTFKLNSNFVGIGLMILSAFCTAFGQLFWKLSDAALNIELIIGFILYFLGALTMTIAFRFGQLSILHPLLSIGYVISLFLGVLFLNETISLNAIIGVIFIISGVFIIGGESN
ncbi:MULTISPECIES: EamA family transporter [Neobacillus]|jgi:drug/metabolite transporter (DMT)-like permease|uniref:EamA family transporter n=1 Tax=Neobacillus sedimentimangrovi TaxID=2699460 RepID=A0ABS8QFN3_9BACI|nr:EamA family transporter [Neobacillus sedimentimangrovi]AIM16233.1 membrane protein [Bacillus sp. X1(2014)]MCD4838005.1 EamA family transporter [Neobacillus sedimentimangrovi]